MNLEAIATYARMITESVENIQTLQAGGTPKSDPPASLTNLQSMKLPVRWTRKAAEAAFAAGTADLQIGKRHCRIVVDAGLKNALASWPKTGLHRHIIAGPWTSTGELEVRLAPLRRLKNHDNHPA